VERQIVALAETQSGVVGRAQLRVLGLSERQIDWRITVTPEMEDASFVTVAR
jgi:hypothetical protein